MSRRLLLIFFTLTFSFAIASADVMKPDGRFLLVSSYEGENQPASMEFFPDGKCVVDGSYPGTFQTYEDGRLLLEFTGKAGGKEAKAYHYEISGAVMKLTASGSPSDYYLKPPPPPHPAARDLVGRFSRHRVMGEIHLDTVWECHADMTFKMQTRLASPAKGLLMEATHEGTWDYVNGIVTFTTDRRDDPRPRKLKQFKGAVLGRDELGLRVIDSATGATELAPQVMDLVFPPLPEKAAMPK